MGNAVVAVPSERWPLLATDLYQVLDTSDLPGGVLNIVTGPREELAPVLAAHDDVDAIWYWGSAEGAAAVERLSAGNLKQTWAHHGPAMAWEERGARRGGTVPAPRHPDQERLGAVRGVARRSTSTRGLAGAAREAAIVIFLPRTFCSTSDLRRAAQPSSSMLAPDRRGAIRRTSFFRVNSAVTESTTAVCPRSSPSATRRSPLARSTRARSSGESAANSGCDLRGPLRRW